MDGAEGVVGGVELGDVHLHARIFREGIDDIASGLHLLDDGIHRAHGVIQVAALALGILAHVGMAGQEVHRELLVAAEGQEVAHPVQGGGAAADRRAAHAHLGHGFLHCLDGGLVQLMVGRLVRVLPETGQIGLVPHFAGPGGDLLLAVAIRQVAQGGFHHVGPLLVVGRRSRVALPIEDGLGAAGHLLRHEAQLDEGLEAQSPVIIHDPVKIGEVVPLMLCALSVRPGLVDGHVIAEEAVAADVLEMAQLLGHGKLVVVFLLHRQTHAACTDAVSSVVVEARPAVRRDGDIQRFHQFMPPCISSSQRRGSAPRPRRPDRFGCARNSRW